MVSYFLLLIFSLNNQINIKYKKQNKIVFSGSLSNPVPHGQAFQDQASASGHPASNRVALTANLRRSVEQLDTATMPTFDKDSPYMPRAVKEAIEKRVRPSASARSQMVERIVDHCREKVPNLQRAMLNSSE